MSDTDSAPTPRKKQPNPLALVLGLSAAFFVIFLVVSGVLFMAKGRSRGGASSGGFFGKGSVGVVELNGVILDSKQTLRRLERFEEDDDIKAVVLRLNSPGGAVAPSQEIYQAVRNYKKPLVVSMSSVAASGAFYIACGAKKVFANPGTLTGSIGVIMEFINLEKLYDWARIKRYAIKTGKYKGTGAEYRDMTPDEKALLQNLVDDVLVQFKQAVSEGRKLPLDKVSSIADGRVLSGSQAKALKLVDELGTFQDAVEEAGKLGQIKGKPPLVYPQRAHHGLLDLLTDGPPGGGDDDSTSSSTASAGTWLARLLSWAAGSVAGGSPGVEPGPGVYWLWLGAR